MTVYEELWNDLSFIERRIKEQQDYIAEIHDRKLSFSRLSELTHSAMEVYSRFRLRRIELWKRNTT